jgi:hypothetical protein
MAQTQSGFKEDLRRMQCDQRRGFAHSELTSVGISDPISAFPTCSILDTFRFADDPSIRHRSHCASRHKRIFKCHGGAHSKVTTEPKLECSVTERTLAAPLTSWQHIAYLGKALRQFFG